MGKGMSAERSSRKSGAEKSSRRYGEASKSVKLPMVEIDAESAFSMARAGTTTFGGVPRKGHVLEEGKREIMLIGLFDEIDFNDDGNIKLEEFCAVYTCWGENNKERMEEDFKVMAEYKMDSCDLIDTIQRYEFVPYCSKLFALWDDDTFVHVVKKLKELAKRKKPATVAQAPRRPYATKSSSFNFGHSSRSSVTDMDMSLDDPVSDKLQQIFKACDSNGDGRLNPKELRGSLGLGAATFDWMDVPDGVGDGRVSMDEFVAGMTETYPTSVYGVQELNGIFRDMQEKAETANAPAESRGGVGGTGTSHGAGSSLDAGPAAGADKGFKEVQVTYVLVEHSSDGPVKHPAYAEEVKARAAAKKLTSGYTLYRNQISEIERAPHPNEAGLSVPPSAPGSPLPMLPLPPPVSESPPCQANRRPTPLIREASASAMDWLSFRKRVPLRV